MLKIIFSLSLITIGTKILGVAEKIVIAHAWGTSPTADVYFSVVGLIFSVIFLIRELIFPTLLPVFNKSLNDSPGCSQTLVQKFFIQAGGVLFLLSLLLFFFSPYTVHLLFPGFSSVQKQNSVLYFDY
jgi:peptidoglycan biosynthesis protein MviN/MurJ (putative lipid II flippase)